MQIGKTRSRSPGKSAGADLALAGPHPVAVALDGVDLAVVRDQPVGVGQRPAREGVGREARVHQRQLGGEPLVGQVGEERLELAGREHALVDHGAGRQRREVDLGLVLGTLAQAEGDPVELEAGQAALGGDEQLAEVGHALAGGPSDEVGGDGHVAPRDDPQALAGGDVLDPLLGGRPLGGAVGQVGHAHGVGPGRREVGVEDGPEERVRDLGEDARAVTDQRVGAGGAAVVEVAQGVEGVDDDVVPRSASHRRHQGHTAGVVLVLAAVQAGVGGLGGEAGDGHVASPSSGSSAAGDRARQGQARTALATSRKDNASPLRLAI